MLTMDASELHSRPSKNLLDRIAADPAIINRGIDPGDEPVQSVDGSTAASPSAAIVGPSEPIVIDRDPTAHRVVEINLMKDALPTEQAAPAPVVKSVKRSNMAAMVVAGVVVMAALGAAYYLASTRSQLTAKVSHLPTPAPTLVTSPSPTVAAVTPTVTPVATVAPVPTSAPTSVSAPAVAPSSGHPQSVVVKSPSGLWLRSTPDSSSRSNIIGWMPDGASVSVDQVGDFWWHGSYGGQAGYFAVSYTN